MPVRPLTPAEIALAQTVYGDAITYETVRISDEKMHPLHPKGTGITPNDTLYMYGCHHADYAAGTPGVRGHFIHEMAHVWQFQNNILNPVISAAKLAVTYRFNYNAAYAYRLDAARDLLSYNMEQQASIIQDYFLLTRCTGFQGKIRCLNTDDRATLVTLYKAVLAKFLDNPGYGRPPAGNTFNPLPPGA